MKINSKVHGIIDYLLVVFLWASPGLFFMPRITSIVTYILGSIHLLLTVFTNYQPGLFKFVPIKVHGQIELVIAIVLLFAAFYLGSIDGAISRNFYLGVAIGIFIFWSLSDYRRKTNPL